MSYSSSLVLGLDKARATTPKWLRHLRAYYTLATNAITRYEEKDLVNLIAVHKTRGQSPS